jgi:hypothetical protein
MKLKNKITGLLVGTAVIVGLGLAGSNAIAAPVSQAGIKQATQATSVVTKVWHCRRWSGGWGCRR